MVSTFPLHGRDLGSIPNMSKDLNMSLNYLIRQKDLQNYKISEDVRRVNSEQRKFVHLAAVFANNFSNRMFSVAEEILKDANIDFDILIDYSISYMTKVIVI